jgi:AhpD family alkylhydroperoxidase
MYLLQEIEEAWNNFSTAAYKPRALDGKTKELIAVSNSIMADCVPCIEYHYNKAVAAGATNEELAEAFAIAMAISAGSKKAKYSSLIQALEAKKED